MHLELTKIFQRKNCRFTGLMVIRSQAVALAFWKLNLAAIHEPMGMAYPFPMHPGIERRERPSCGKT